MHTAALSWNAWQGAQLPSAGIVSLFQKAGKSKILQTFLWAKSYHTGMSPYPSNIK